MLIRVVLFASHFVQCAKIIIVYTEVLKMKVYADIFKGSF